VQEVWNKEFGKLQLEWENPFKKLMFEGVPFKEMVNCMPTQQCLIELVQMPFLVVDMDEVEIVSLERVGHSTLRNFDANIIFKDFSRPVQPITSIPNKRLDAIKEWLTSAGITVYENKHNMKWDSILKQIVNDPESFVEAGGWNGFLNVEESDGDEEGIDEDSEFEPSSSEEEEEEDDDSSDYVDSDDEESGSEVDEDEESGKDWDELEAEAIEDDEARETDDDEPQKKRKGGGSKGGAAKKAKR